MGDENRWQIELLTFRWYTFMDQKVMKGSELMSARILSLLSEEGVYTETLEKFYLSSVLVTHSCLY